MIGYCKKDMYLQKKMIMMLILMYIVLVGFGLALRYSFDYGNLSKQGADSVMFGKTTCETLMPVLVAIVSGFMLVNIPVGSIDMDIKNHFNMLAFSTGKLEHSMVAAKLLELLAAFCISNIAMLLYGLLFGVLFGFKNVKTGFIMGYILIGIIVAIGCVALPLTYLLKKADLACGLIIITMWLFLMVYVFAFQEKIEHFLNKLNVGKLGDLFEYNAVVMIFVSLAFLALLFAVSYFASIRVMKRRNRLCGA